MSTLIVLALSPSFQRLWTYLNALAIEWWPQASSLVVDCPEKTDNLFPAVEIFCNCNLEFDQRPWNPDTRYSDKISCPCLYFRTLCRVSDPPWLGSVVCKSFPNSHKASNPLRISQDSHNLFSDRYFQKPDPILSIFSSVSQRSYAYVKPMFRPSCR